MRRITIDLDTKDPFYIFSTLLNIFRSVKNITYIEVTPSNSKGWHFIIWTGKDYSEQKINSFRKKLGDDIIRINTDKHRKIGKQTLFDYKETMKGGKKNGRNTKRIKS